MSHLSKGDCKANSSATIEDYYALPQDHKLIIGPSGITPPSSTEDRAQWDAIYDDIAIATLLLNNSKNEPAKTSLRHAFANSNKEAYKSRADGMSRLLHIHYRVINTKNPYTNTNKKLVPRRVIRMMKKSHLKLLGYL